MAHPTDYPSQRDISKLRKSSQPKIQPQTPHDIVNHFLSNHAHWSIDSISKYLLMTHKGEVTKHHISEGIKSYIFGKEF